jgi:ribosomal protein S27AE
MIIDNQLKNKKYFEIIGSSNLSKYDCPKCGAKASMTRHAYYERNVISIINAVMIYTILKILRVKCTSCGSTHAILPSDIIPYKQFDYLSFMTILENYFSDAQSGYELSTKFNVSFQTIYSFINTFLIFKDSTFITLRIMEIIEKLFSKKSSKLIGCLKDEIGFINFISHFQSINHWPYLMTKYRTVVTNGIFVGFQ